MKTWKVCLFLSLHSLLYQQVFTYNILLLVPFGSSSHKNSIDPAINELVSRGHKVTEVAMELNKNSTGIRQYSLDDAKQYLKEKMGNRTDMSPFAPQEQQQNDLTLIYYFIIEIGSHKNSIDPAINELIARGHKITEVAMEVNNNSTGIRQYELQDVRKLLMEQTISSNHNPFAPAEEQENMLTLLYNLTKDTAGFALQDRNLIRFLEETRNEKFDVVILNALFNEISLPIAHKYKAPLILWSPAGLFPYTAWTLNVPFPPSYVTSPFLYFKAPLTFINRLYNTVFNIVLIFGRQYLLLPAIEEIYRNYTTDPFPPLAAIESNASLILVNSHIAMEEARPLMPNVINVGGMHCKSPKPLPKDLDEIASGSGSNGFIVFSLGSVVKGTQMPQTLVDMFLRVFGKLKQKVIWKFEGKADKVPKNVIFKDWIPQQDLMGHPNCRLAILHGGLNGLQEAVYHGIPVLGMPLGADRDSNLAISVSSGMAEIFDWRTATDDILSQKIDLLLNNPKYKENAKRLSAILKDRPETPAETAAYWIEYVIRHKGAQHLKANANHLYVFQYFLIDVFIVLIPCIFLSLVITWFILKVLLMLLGRLLLRPKDLKVKKY